MAFTALEFMRGAWTALLLFNGCILALRVIETLTSLLTSSGSTSHSSLGEAFWAGIALVALVSSLATCLFGVPLALLLGMALRSVPAFWVHRVCFALLGCVVTLCTYALFMSNAGTGFTGSAWPGMLAAGVPTALAVCIGWEYTARRALASDAARMRAHAE